MISRAGARGRILGVLKDVPPGRVTTADAIASQVGVSSAETAKVLASLTDDERQAFPWQRVVAKGGAIGRGPWRERQFALLVREGLAVSPAGIVQDLPRVMIFDLGAPLAPEPKVAPLPSQSRSRGMRDRP